MDLCSGPDPPDLPNQPLKPLIGSATPLMLLGNIPVHSHAFMIQATHPHVGVQPCASELSFCLRDVPSAPAAALCPGRWLGQLNLAKIRQKEDMLKIDIPSKVKLFLYELITQNPSHCLKIFVGLADYSRKHLFIRSGA